MSKHRWYYIYIHYAVLLPQIQFQKIDQTLCRIWWRSLSQLVGSVEVQLPIRSPLQVEQNLPGSHIREGLDFCKRPCKWPNLVQHSWTCWIHFELINKICGRHGRWNGLSAMFRFGTQTNSIWEVHPTSVPFSAPITVLTNPTVHGRTHANHVSSILCNLHICAYILGNRTYDAKTVDVL